MSLVIYTSSDKIPVTINLPDNMLNILSISEIYGNQSNKGKLKFVKYVLWINTSSLLDLCYSLRYKFKSPLTVNIRK